MTKEKGHSNVTKVRTIRPQKTKNISKTIFPGFVIKTRDEFFFDGKGYTKPKYKDMRNILYRQTVVVATNSKDELGVIKIQSGGKLEAKNKRGQIERYNPYIKTKDNDGKPIKLSNKFVRDNPEYDFDTKTAEQILDSAINNDNKRIRNTNKKILRDLKKRKTN